MPRTISRLESSFDVLSDLAKDKLAESGVMPEVALIAGMSSVNNARAEVDREFLPYPALVIRYKNLNGSAMTFDRDGIRHPFIRVRYLDPKAGLPGAHPKYMSFRSSGVHAYFPIGVGIDWAKVTNQVSVPIVLTEGEFKALKACSLGIPTIGFSGVDCFGRAS